MWTVLRLGKSSTSCLHDVMSGHLLARRLFRAAEVRMPLTSASYTYPPPSSSSSLAPVQVSYGIGLPHPLSVYVDTYKTGKLPDEAIQEAVLDKFDFRPGKIMQVCGRSRGCRGTLWRLQCVSAQRVFAAAAPGLQQQATERLCLLCNCRQGVTTFCSTLVCTMPTHPLCCCCCRPMPCCVSPCSGWTCREVATSATRRRQHTVTLGATMTQISLGSRSCR